MLFDIRKQKSKFLSKLNNAERELKNIIRNSKILENNNCLNTFQ